MKKISFILGLLFNALLAFSQSTVNSYTFSRGFVSLDPQQIYQGLRIAAPTMTLPNSMTTYTYSKPFNNSDWQQVYEAARGLGDAISTNSVNSWNITGNAINTNTNFIGTTTNRSLLFYTNNVQRFKIDSINRALFTTTLILQDGSQGAGKVLTSDANGVATWSTVSGGGGSYVPYSGATGSVNLNDQDLGNVNTLVIGKATGTNTIPLLSTDGSGTAFNTDVDPSIVTARLFDPNTNVNGHGFVNADVFTKNATYTLSHNSYRDNSSYGGTANYGHHSSYENNFGFSSTGTISDVYGWYDKYLKSSGRTNSRYGFYYADATGGGTLTNQYALYVPSISAATTSNYAIYINGTSNPIFTKSRIILPSMSASAGAQTPKLEFHHGSSPQLISYINSTWNGTNDRISLYNAKFNLTTWKESFYVRGATTSNNLTDTCVVATTNFKSFSSYNEFIGTSVLNGLNLASGSVSVTSKGINVTAGDAATINSPTGRFRKDTSGNTFVLTNNLITANSIVFVEIVTTGVTSGYDLAVTANAGSVTITFQTAGSGAAPNTDCDVNFWVIN